VPASDLNDSQYRRGRPPDLPPRAAATLFFGLSDDFFAATMATPGEMKAERAHPLEQTLDAPPL
jgi:hypothetical protein